MSWLCSCGLVNSGLNEEGSCSKAFNDSREHYQVTPNKPDFYQAVVAAKGLGLHNMTEQEELFKTFYNREKIFVKDMDIVQLREHRDMLAKIAFEAKARLVAVDDESRERNAKNKNKDWLTTTTTPDHVTSDAVNAVKVRAARMSKMDKLKKQLESAGIDDETIAVMIKNMERKATEKDVKAITFNKPTVEQDIIIIKTEKPKDNGDDTPFDPSALFK